MKKILMSLACALMAVSVAVAQKQPTETRSSNYGKIMQDGISIEVNDYTLLWLEAQGVYGKAMANKLRNGETQIIDFKANGAGILRNLEVDDPKLTDRQERRICGPIGLFEGRRLYNAREEIRRLATFDYKKFIQKY